MAIKKRKYTMLDMVEQDISTAPSLDLPNIYVEKFFMPKDGGKFMLFFANINKEWKPKDGCPYCGADKDSLSRSGKNLPRIIKDVSRNNYCVQIAIQTQRFECKCCHNRFTGILEGVLENATMTERLLDFVKTESFLQPHTDIEERTGLSIQTIQNIMDGEIKKYEDMRAENPLVAPRVLGIDEKHIVNEMRGTLVDVENGNLLDLTEKNNQYRMTEAIKKLKDWDKNIEVVTTDMANSYLSWLPKLLPRATFVIDKFHVVQNVNTKVSKTKSNLYKYRKNLISEITDATEKKRQAEILRLVSENPRLFNYSTENLERGSGKKALKLDTIISEFPEFALLRKLYAYIELLYQQTNREDAEKVWNEWQKLLPPTKEKEYEKWCNENNVPLQCFEMFQSLKRSGFTGFKKYILNYFNPGCNFTNAATEGLNNLIGSINASGNGYKFKHLRAKALYASLIHERVRFSIDIKSIKAWKPSNDYIISHNDGETSLCEIYCFTQETESVSIPPVNIFMDNKEFLNSLLSENSYIGYEFTYNDADHIEKYFDRKPSSLLKLFNTDK